MVTIFETGHGKPKSRLEELIALARHTLGWRGKIDAETYLDGMRIDTADLMQDQQAFERQRRLLGHGPTIVVDLADGDGLSGATTATVPVDLQLKGGLPIREQVVVVAGALREAGFDVRVADEDMASDAFTARLAETAALRALHEASADWPPGASMVSSRRRGDDILCAKGWFLSTSHVVGQSKCAVAVPPGRYCLGASGRGKTRYHDHLFDLPIADIHLHLP